MEILGPALVLFVFMTIGATVQSLSGVGFGMVSVPFLVAVLGPSEGVFWGNVAGLVNAVVLTVIKRKDVQWRQLLLLASGALPLILLAVYLQTHMSKGFMDFFIGTLMLLMIAGSFFALRFPKITHPLFAVFTGGLAGFMSASVAQSGPVMVAYAQATRWNQLKFAATMQPLFIVFNGINVPAKLGAGMGEHFFPALGMSLLTISAGTLVAKYLPLDAKFARKLAIFIAIIGSTMVLVRGVNAVFF